MCAGFHYNLFFFTALPSVLTCAALCYTPSGFTIGLAFSDVVHELKLALSILILSSQDILDTAVHSPVHSPYLGVALRVCVIVLSTSAVVKIDDCP
jgi:hypothetical protein